MNRKNRPSLGKIGLGLALAVSLGLPVAAPGAPGELSQTPLFLGQGVEPNIFFVLDDSGSMDWDVLKSLGAIAAHPPVAEGHSHRYDDQQSTVFPPDRDDRILEYCVGYNVLAYDPTVAYTPWAGADSAGDPYGNLTLASARTNPYDPASTVDIGNRLYFPWTDGDGDGDYDVGECPQPNPADYGGDIGANDCPASGCVAVSRLSGAAQVNYANWYSYYRKREHVLKRAVSAAVDGATRVRMGIASLHNSGDNATPISAMSDTSSASACGTGITNKDCLLQRLSLVDSRGFTPLRRALDAAGHYFDQNDGGIYHEYLGSNARSPILTEADGGACQQNFTILVSDGFWNQTWPTTDSAGQTLASHGDADGDNSSAWDGGAQADGSAPPIAPESCTLSFGTTDGPITVDTLADIAMHYYEKDLSDLEDKVGVVPGIDENRQQHMVTFTIALGVNGNLRSNPANRTDPFGWPPICDNELWTVDDMRHAAWNGHGQFLSARSPESVSKALSDTVASITARKATMAAVEFNTNTLTSGTLLFQGMTDTTDWSGDLRAYDAEDLMADIKANGRISIDPVWSAADGLDALSNAEALRRVVLTRGASGEGVALHLDTATNIAATWAALSASQQSDLKRDGSGALDGDAIGQARLSYLVGDRSCEVGGDGPCATDINDDGVVSVADKSLRERGSRLGGIFDSEPLVIGMPTRTWPSSAPFPTIPGETFADFKAELTDHPRMEVVYVGANDGMLHGFNVENGHEVLAYLPASLASSALNAGYHRLSDPNYTHRFYVDRTPTVNHAYIPAAAGGTAAWRTVAVGGLGAGGRGLYALDITNPDDFDTANPADILLWELANSDDPELGLTLSEPTIVMMNNGKWAAIVGSGYNDTGPDLDAHLFVIFLEGGLDGVWTEGSDYFKIEALDAETATLGRNGLSSPKAADLDGNGTTDRVYAGDLFGNVWAFDVSDANPNRWGVASGVDASGTTTTAPLFTAEITTGGGSTRQPITIEPAISKHPSQIDLPGNQPNVMVYVGTGQYLTEADEDSTDAQSFYGIWDSGRIALTRSDLQAQTIDTDFAGQEVVTDHPVEWTDQNGDGITRFGWYLDLPDPGERVVVDPVLRGGIVFFNSMIPATVKCAGGGTGYLYSVDMENGGAPNFATFDYNNDGIVDANDVATSTDGSKTEHPSRDPFLGEIPGGRPKFLDNKQFTVSSDGSILFRKVFQPGVEDTGRLSWQELTAF